jgi:ribulose 1,5-bisphosphate carboxylase large subunit-like protein
LTTKATTLTLITADINVSGDLHLTTPGGRLVGWPTGSGGGDEDDGRRDAIPDPIIPQELEDVSRKVEKELKDAIESFMSKGHAALAPRGGASQS